MKEDKILYQEFVQRINFNKKKVTWSFSTSQDAKHNVQFNKNKSAQFMVVIGTAL